MRYPFIHTIIIAAAGTVVIVIAMMLMRRAMGRSVEDALSRKHIRSFSRVIGVLLALLLLGFLAGVPTESLTVAAGLVGAGIAFALQEVIISFAGWMAILLAKFYRVGDRVELGGMRGDVIEIGILRTRIMEIGQWVRADLYNGRVVLIANSFVFKEPVFNYSHRFPFVWDEFTLPIRYDSDRALAFELLGRAARDVTACDAAEGKAAWESFSSRYALDPIRTDPMVTLVATDNWVEYTVRYLVRYNERRVRMDQLFRRVLEELDKSDGKVSLGSATQQIIQPSSIDVVIKQGAEKKDG